jgi:hypothetical protein
MFRIFSLFLFCLVAGCVAPVRTRILQAPAAPPCNLKTYALVAEEQNIATEYRISDERRKTLETMLQEKLAQLGLTPAPPAANPDVTLAYMASIDLRPATAQPTDVTMASDYVLGTLDLTMTRSNATEPLYRGVIRGIVGDVKTVNQKRLKQEIDNAFKPFEGCPVSR